jgi:hypothetical protein
LGKETMSAHQSNAPLPEHSMTEEAAFRRAQTDPKFRELLLASWSDSRKKAFALLIGTIVGFGGTLVYSGFVHGRWAPNLYWAALVILMLWMRSRAETNLAALRAMDEKKEPNQPPEPTRFARGSS